MRLSFTVAAGLRQRSHSQARVPRNSWSYFTVSISRFLQPGGPSPRIYIPQEQGGPVTPPSTEFPFHRLLRLAGLRWRYSNPPSDGIQFMKSLQGFLYRIARIHGNSCRWFFVTKILHKFHSRFLVRTRSLPIPNHTMYATSFLRFLKPPTRSSCNRLAFSQIIPSETVSS
jgi:hypothetical protein